MSAAEAAAPSPGDTLVGAALKVLGVGDPWKKAEYTRIAHELWSTREISQVVGGDEPPCPSRPARDYEKMKLVSPGQMPRLGKGGSLASQQAIVHSLAHIENWAVDLSWDIIARFGREPSYELPEEFFDDWVTVALEEAKHYSLLAHRLEGMGTYYGALPVHDGLWESATRTAGSLGARLAVEHCVHEARGLDVLPQTVARLRKGGDSSSADLLWNIVYEEEITHCAAGVRWLSHLHNVATSSNDQDEGWKSEAAAHSTTQEWFHSLIRENFHGSLKPPFNNEARAKAGFGEDWYMPLDALPTAAGKSANGSGQQVSFDSSS